VPAEVRQFLNRLPWPLWVAVAAVVLMIAAVGLRIGCAAYWQHVAILELQNAGCLIETRPNGPEWLRRWFDDQSLKPFDDVVSVSMSRSNRIYDGYRWNGCCRAQTELTERTGGCLATLTELETLDLGCTTFNDAGLVRLARLTTLTRLALDGTEVSDAGLAALHNFPRLQILSLNNTGVTDDGLARLAGSSRLFDLSLSRTRVSDAGLVHLKRLTSVKGFWLFDTKMTDAGLLELKRAIPGADVLH
jgi:hypothetical protein